MLPRSYLFVPGNRPERFEKAFASGADRVIVDLEDAVGPGQKADARLGLTRWLGHRSDVLVRVNGVATPWFDEDLQACRQAGVAGIVLPKAECDHALAHVREALGAALFPIVESAPGLDNAKQLARVDGVTCLMFGSIDFKLDMGIDGDREELLAARSALVLASRLARIGAPVDGVTAAIDDAGQIQSDTVHARKLGFSGKLCIHPRQIAPVHAAFAPSPEQIAWARRVVAAAGAGEQGAVALDGKMIDLPVILQAEHVLRKSARST